jgi:acetylornithine aminotransferase
LLSGFARVPFNDIAAIRQVASSNQDVVAVLVEPLQGEGGVNLAATDYMVELRKICDEFGLLMMLDEVQTGIARTGTWFAFQHSGVMPDVMALAKGLGGGVPIGACLARGDAAEVFKPGNHGSTFGGNPLACAAALATLEAVEKQSLRENADKVGSYLRASLKEKLGDVAGVVDIRGQGLMIGIELDRPCGDIVANMRDCGFLVNVTADKVIRLVPPLIFSQANADELLPPLVEEIRVFLAG